MFNLVCCCVVNRFTTESTSGVIVYHVQCTIDIQSCTIAKKMWKILRPNLAQSSFFPFTSFHICYTRPRVHKSIFDYRGETDDCITSLRRCYGKISWRGTYYYTYSNLYIYKKYVHFYWVYNRRRFRQSHGGASLIQPGRGGGEREYTVT